MILQIQHFFIIIIKKITKIIPVKYTIKILTFKHWEFISIHNISLKDLQFKQFESNI
jgi:hypothetical protein